MPDVPYATQLCRKRGQLQAWFPDLAVGEVAASPREWGFRHKVAFAFAPHTGSADLVMGHFQAGSHRVMAIDECPVHSARGNRLAFALRDALRRGRVPPGVLRHVLIRTSDDEREAVVMLVVTANHPSLRGPVRAFLEGVERPDGFLLNIHDRPGPYMVGPTTLRLAGRAHVRDEGHDAVFQIAPTAFFQTNVGAARVLVSTNAANRMRTGAPNADSALTAPAGSISRTSGSRSRSASVCAIAPPRAPLPMMAMNGTWEWSGGCSLPAGALF